MVDNPERILRRSSTQADKGVSHLQRVSSFPTESNKSFTSVDFDKETDQSFPRSKYETELCQVLTGPERPNLFRPTQQPSHPSPTIVVQNPVTYSTDFVSPLIPSYTVVFPNPPIVMVTRFAPLVLPAQLHDLPLGYSQRIKTYGAEGDVSVQQHISRFNVFCDLEEVDHADAKIRLFAQSLTGEVKEWFRGFLDRSVHDFLEFETIFLGKWERKKNSLHLLTQYNNLRTPSGAAKLHYVYAFSSEFNLLLRERIFVSLEDMMDDATEVEVNLSAYNRNK